MKGGKGSGMEGAEGGVAKIGSGPRRGRSWGEEGRRGIKESAGEVTESTKMIKGEREKDNVRGVEVRDGRGVS